MRSRFLPSYVRARLGAWFAVGVLLLPVGAGVSAAEERPLRVTFTGQALVQHDLRAVAPEKFRAMTDALRANASDVVFTDLETVINTGAGKATRDSQFFHAAGPEVIDGLKTWGFNLLALGNNHAWDLGAPGILGTIAEVKARDMVFAGTGANLAAASAPTVLTTPRGRVALVAFASGKIAEGGAATDTRAGVNEVKLDEKTGDIDRVDAERVFAALRLAARSAEVVIAYQHDHYWEKDNRVTPEWKRRFARACLDAGATVFVSHGAPMLHGIELYRGRPIFYDLGGLVFHTITAPGYYLPEIWESVIADAEFAGGKLVALKLRPVALNERGVGDPPSKRFYETRGAPSLATGDAARAILDRLARLSAPYGTRLVIAGDAATLDFSPTKHP